jgi:hypothetical protein
MAGYGYFWRVLAFCGPFWRLLAESSGWLEKRNEVYSRFRFYNVYLIDVINICAFSCLPIASSRKTSETQPETSGRKWIVLATSGEFWQVLAVLRKFWLIVCKKRKFWLEHIGKTIAPVKDEREKRNKSTMGNFVFDRAKRSIKRDDRLKVVGVAPLIVVLVISR